MDLLVIFGKRSGPPEAMPEALEVIDEFVDEENDGEWIARELAAKRADDVYSDVVLARIEVPDGAIESLFESKTIPGKISRSKSSE